MSVFSKPNQSNARPVATTLLLLWRSVLMELFRSKLPSSSLILRQIGLSFLILSCRLPLWTWIRASIGMGSKAQSALFLLVLQSFRNTEIIPSVASFIAFSQHILSIVEQHISPTFRFIMPSLIYMSNFYVFQEHSDCFFPLFLSFMKKITQDPSPVPTSCTTKDRDIAYTLNPKAYLLHLLPTFSYLIKFLILVHFIISIIQRQRPNLQMLIRIIQSTFAILPVGNAGYFLNRWGRLDNPFVSTIVTITFSWISSLFLFIVDETERKYIISIVMANVMYSLLNVIGRKFEMSERFSFVRAATVFYPILGLYNVVPASNMTYTVIQALQTPHK